MFKRELPAVTNASDVCELPNRGNCAVTLLVANPLSSGYRGLQGPPTTLLPVLAIKRNRNTRGCTDALRRRGAGKRAMNAMAVVIVPECLQFPHRIDRVPDEYTIEKLAANSTDQSLDERMRKPDDGAELIFVISRMGRLASHRWNRNNGSWSLLACLVRLWPTLARLYILHTRTPSMPPGSTPKPMMQQLNTSMTTSPRLLPRRWPQ